MLYSSECEDQSSRSDGPYQLIHTSVRAGDLHEVKRVLATPACQSHEDSMPFYAFALAVQWGHLELARYFITDTEAGVNHVHVDNPFVSNSLLWAAMESENEAMVRFIIDEVNSDPHAVDADGTTAIMRAALRSLEGIVRMMALDMGVDFLAVNATGHDVLYYAVRGGQADIAAFLVDEMGLNVEREYEGLGLLHVAGQFGHVGVTRWLVEVKGLEYKATLTEGKTPLHYAGTSLFPDVLSVLKYYILEWGVPVDARDELQRTVLHYAIEWRMNYAYIPKIKWLVEVAGADIDARDVHGDRPQDLVAKKGGRDTVEYLEFIRSRRKVRPYPSETFSRFTFFSHLLTNRCGSIRWTGHLEGWQKDPRCLLTARSYPRLGMLAKQPGIRGDGRS